MHPHACTKSVHCAHDTPISGRVVRRVRRAGLLASSQVSESAAPDLILVGGRVYTLDSGRPWAEALAIRGDRIAGVGTSAEMRQARGPVDARDRSEAARSSLPASTMATSTWTSTGALLDGRNLLDVHEPKPFRERIAQAASAAAGGQLDHARRLGRVRAMGRGLARAQPQQPAPRAAPSCPIAGSSTT